MEFGVLKFWKVILHLLGVNYFWTFILDDDNSASAKTRTDTKKNKPTTTTAVSVTTTTTTTTASIGTTANLTASIQSTVPIMVTTPGHSIPVTSAASAVPKSSLHITAPQISDSHSQIRVSWVYSLHKPELQTELESRGLDVTGTMDELRYRLVTHLRTPINTPTTEEKRYEFQNTDRYTNLAGYRQERESPIHQNELVLESVKEIIGLPPYADAAEVRRRLTDIQHKAKILEQDYLPFNPTSMPAPPTFGIRDTASNHPGHEEPITRRETYYEANADTASLCNLIRKWNLRFDGRRDPISFIERLKEMMESYEIPPNRTLKAIPEILYGNALLWWRNYRDSWRNFDDFLHDFEQQYLPPGYYRSLDREIQERTQGEKESCRDFVVALSTLIRRRGGFNEEAKLERIYNNLKPDYKYYIRRHEVKTTGELIKRAEEYETLQREQAKYRPPPPPAQALTSETAYYSKSQRRPHETSPVYLDEIHHRKPNDGNFRNQFDHRNKNPNYRPSYTPPNQTEQRKDEGKSHVRPETKSSTNPLPRESLQIPSQAFYKSTKENQEQRYSPICWNCNKSGHLFRECRLPRKVRCYYCKKEGQRTDSCPCRSGNGKSVPLQGEQ